MTDTKTTTTTKAWLEEQFQTLQQQLRVLSLQVEPAPIVFYKPLKDGTGRALRVQIRLRPTFRGNIPRAAGAVFLELAAQKSERDANGNALFDWENTLTAKLGVPDLTGILYAMRCRVLRIPVSEKDSASISLFHQFKDAEGSEQSTVIKYELQKDRAMLSVSKSKTVRSSIGLTLQEEVALEAYLQHALQWAMFTGKR